MDVALHSEVLKCLDKKWSPVIIQHHLKASYPERPEMQISHECLYQWLYREAEAMTTGESCGWPVRAVRCVPVAVRRIAAFPHRVGIEERPEDVEERSRIGDWEGDTVVSKQNKGGIVTFVDRTSRFLLAAHVADKRATTFSEASIQQFGWVPKSLCLTLTLDNGTEMADHARIGKAKEMDVYFAHPHAPWQRGANEQVNAFYATTSPKGRDFS
jgi:transposase, IS30 family